MFTPITGVDKAKAVVGVQPDGSVLSFENEKNLEAFSKGVAS